MLKKGLNPLGFTLIELMVVISIISILSVVGYVTYSNTLKSSRISRRIEDLDSLNKALISYKTANGKYPVVTKAVCADDATIGLAQTSPPSSFGPPFVPNYMQSIPKDPDSVHCYYYDSDSTGANYKLTTDPSLTEMSPSNFSSQSSLIDPASSPQVTDWAYYTPSVAKSVISPTAPLLTPAPSPSPSPTAGGNGGGGGGGGGIGGGGGGGGGSTTYQSMIKADGAVAYWRLSDTGTSISDQSSSGHFTAITCSSYPCSPTTSGLLEQQAGAILNDTDTAISFNGTTGYIYIPVSQGSGLDISSPPLTIEAWVKPSNNTTTGRIFSRGETGVNGYGLTQVNNVFNLGRNGGSNFSGTTVIVPGQWYHVVAVYNGSAEQLWVNGNLDATSTVTIPTSTTSYPATIGAELNGTGNGLQSYFSGTIDEVAIYNKALTPSQIINHCMAGEGSAKCGGYASTVLADQPVSYWRLGDQGTTTVSDMMTTNPGALSGGVTTGVLGGITDPNTAMSFDGSTGKVQVQSASNLAITGDITLEAWINPRNYNTWNKFICKCANEGQLNYLVAPYMFFLSAQGSAAGSGVLAFARGNGSTDTEIFSSTVIPTNTWTYVVATQSGSNVTIYVNGVAVKTGTITSSITDLGNPLYIGYGPYNYFAGSIDEVAVYNKALTQAQITAHYSAAKVSTLKNGLVGYWKMDETSGSAVNDLLGSHNGTANGTTILTGSNNCQVSNCRGFNGTSDGIVGSDSGLPAGTSPRSISAWFKAPATSPGHESDIFSYGGVGTGSSAIIIGLNPSGNLFVSQWGAQVNSGTNSYFDNHWHQFVVTFDGTTYLVYIDGNQVGSGTMTTNTTLAGSSGLNIGWVSVGNRYWSGSIDEVGIWNRALSSADIQNIYNTQNGGSNILGVATKALVKRDSIWGVLHQLLPFLPADFPLQKLLFGSTK